MCSCKSNQVLFSRCCFFFFAKFCVHFNFELHRQMDGNFFFKAVVSSPLFFTLINVLWAGIQETGSNICHSKILHIYQLFPVFAVVQMKWLPDASLFILFRHEFSPFNPFYPSWKQIPRFFFSPKLVHFISEMDQCPMHVVVWEKKCVYT